jgi:hypothetical protein
MAGRFDIVTTGLQDVYLTGDPQMSYFLTRFKRHTQFAFDVNECQFDGLIDYGGTLHCKIPQFRADFIKNLTIKLARSPLAPVGTSWSPSFMSHLIEFAELYIGGKLIEKITGEYIYLYQQLRNNDFDTRQTLYFLTGHGDLLDTYVGEYVYFLDLPFYFYRNPRLSIPLCALSKQNVEVKIKLRKFNEVILDPSSYGGKINRISLNVENVYVTPEEKSFFMSNEINQMITQLQLSRFKIKPNELKKDVLLHFQNPVREMYFVSQSNVSVNSNFSNQYNKIKSVELKINNETLFHKKGKEVGYDHVLEKYMNSPIASDFGGPIEIEQRKFGPNVFGLHSFALNPMKPEPSGHINMSRIAHKVLSIEIEPLTGINENTLTTQVVTENSTVPFTLTNVTKVPFTETITTDTTTTTITPVTVTKNLITKKERVDTTVTTVTTITENIGLSFNPSVPQTVADVVSSTAVINTLDDPISTVIVSTVDGTPAVTTSVAVSPTVTVFQDPVSVPTSTTLGQKTINSTTIDSTTSKTFPLRTGTVPTNNSTQIELTVTQISTPNTTTPVRVEGDIDDLLQSAVDSTPVVISTGTNAIGTTNTDDTQNVSQGPSLSQPGSGVITFQISNPTDSLGDSTSSTVGVNTGGFLSGTIYIDIEPTVFDIYDVSDYSFDLETTLPKYGNICHISKDGSRIISTNGGLSDVPMHIYRYMTEVEVSQGTPIYSRGGQVTGYNNDGVILTNLFGMEYIETYTNSKTDNNTRFLDHTFNQNVTNSDGSVSVSSYYRLEGTYANYINMSGYTTGTHVGYKRGSGTSPNYVSILPGYSGGIERREDWNFAVGPGSSAAPDSNASFPSTYASASDFYIGWYWSVFIDGIDARTVSTIGLKWFRPLDNKLWEYTGQGNWSEISFPKYNTTTRIHTDSFNLTSAGPNETHINVMRYTESWDAATVGNGTWSTIEQLYQPANTPSMNYGHSMSMGNTGNRLAVSGVVIPSVQSTSANFVVIYDYSNGSWSSNQIQLSTQSGNYGIQVALTGDGNTLCVSMHGNDSGTIDCDGRLFLYTYSNSTWSLSSELDLPTPAPSSPSTSMFGRSIAISDDADTIIVGAPNWSGGRAFLYRITADTIHQIIKNTSSVTNFGHRVDISADGKRVLIGSRTGGVELWSTETTTPSFVSYHNDNGTNQITDVSVNEDGSKFVYSSPESERLYVNDARVTDTEISVTSGIIYNENYTYAPPVNNVQQTITNRQQRIFKVPIQETETPTTTTVATTTPFDSVQEIEDLTSRTEVNVTTRNAITTGTNDTTTTTDGTRDQTEIETTQSLVTVPLVPEQEHDTRVYAVNYNVLTFRDGLAGLRF